MIAGSAGAYAASGPAAGDLVFLADAGFIGEPDLYLGRGNAPLLRNLLQTGGEAFLKSSIAPGAWA